MVKISKNGQYGGFTHGGKVQIWTVRDPKSSQHPFTYKCGRNLSRQSFMFGSLQPLERELVYGQCRQLCLSRTGPRAGYAVTCVFSLPDDNFDRLKFLDVVDALEESKSPSILVAKQNFPPEIKNKTGIFGGNMTASMKAVGTVGVVTDGPSRDFDEIRSMDFQYLAKGKTPGHGNFTVSAINVPVSIAGMDVAPGEIIHMDEHGACKFPENKLEEICQNVEKLEERERVRMSKLENAESAAQVKEILEDG
ncbi:MAG: RraA family protein [Candidatus Bipolaricaulota bacterium]